jgi:hypothetical protein
MHCRRLGGTSAPRLRGRFLTVSNPVTAALIKILGSNSRCNMVHVHLNISCNKLIKNINKLLWGSLVVSRRVATLMSARGASRCVYTSRQQVLSCMSFVLITVQA